MKKQLIIKIFKKLIQIRIKVIFIKKIKVRVLKNKMKNFRFRNSQIINQKKKI